MAARGKVMGNVVVVVAAALVALLVVAAASGAAAFHACGIETESLRTQCRSYCQVGSTATYPGDACCSALSGAQFGCLCQYKNYLPSDIDRNRAMQIPSACKIPGAPSACY